MRITCAPLRIPAGTLSILFGAHCWFIHPFFVAASWWRTFGFPFDPRLWVAFFVHDLGYWGLSNMDDEKGEDHVYYGAGIMGKWFDFGWVANLFDRVWGYQPFGSSWYDFCHLHSRFIASRVELPISMLCVADKRAIIMEPWWFYLPRVILSGEIVEYRSLLRSKYNETGAPVTNREWFTIVKDHVARWLAKTLADKAYYDAERPLEQCLHHRNREGGSGL